MNGSDPPGLGFRAGRLIWAKRRLLGRAAGPIARTLSRCGVCWAEPSRAMSCELTGRAALATVRVSLRAAGPRGCRAEPAELGRELGPGMAGPRAEHVRSSGQILIFGPFCEF
jgi:hypothetical protein